MAGSDQALQSKLGQLAAESNGGVKFSVTTAKQLEPLAGGSLPHTPNRIYQFEFELNGTKQTAVAYTLTLNGTARPATRCESLAGAVAQSDGVLFKLNPFLLAYDYVGNRFLAVSALALFDTFAKEASRRPIKTSESSNFSLSPNFNAGTIHLYGQVPTTSIWTAKVDDLTPESLIEGLRRIATETAAGTERAKPITATLKDRLERRAAVVADPTPLSVPIGQEPSDILVPDRVRSMLRRSIRSSTAVILVGPPGTGKTALLREAISAFASDPAFTDSSPRHDAVWCTPDESWSTRDLVGGDTVVDGEITFSPGCVLRAIAANRWLVLDETNRADMDRIFGGLLTWLSGGTVEIGRASSAQDAPSIELGWNDSSKDCKVVGATSGEITGENGRVQYLAGAGWRLLGTYNAIDAQRVFRFGAALGRRFARVPIPAASPEDFASILEARVGHVPQSIRRRIAQLYAAHHSSPLTRLGPAVFLAVGRYVAAALAENEDSLPVVGEPAKQESSVPSHLEESLAEAYVVSVGTWLAHLEPKDREELKARIIRDGTLTESEWSWITSMMQSLA